jgi:hypothetical protein
MLVKTLLLALVVTALGGFVTLNAQPNETPAEYPNIGGSSIAVEDVTGDGYLDLVVENLFVPIEPNDVGCMHNEGQSNPGFFYGGFTELPYAHQAAFGHLGSEHRDLALGTGAGEIWSNNYTTVNPLTFLFQLSGGTNHWIAFGNINNDAYEDLVSSDYNNPPYVYVHINNGGSLSLQTTLDNGGDADEVKLVDLDYLPYHSVHELCVSSIGNALKYTAIAARLRSSPCGRL